MVYRKRKKYGKRFGRRYRRKRYYKRSKRGYITRTVRSIVNKMSETKFRRLDTENSQLNHNVGLAGTPGPVVYSHLLRTNTGISQEERIGDTVWAKYLKLRIWLSTKSDRPNVMFRIMVVSTPTDQYLTAAPSNFWRNYSGNKILDYVNTDMYSIIYHRIVKITHGDTSLESGSARHEASKMHNIYIPLNRKVSYQTDTSGTPVPKSARNCLSLVIVPYDAYGTLTSDTIASFACCGLFCYKDM